MTNMPSPQGMTIPPIVEQLLLAELTKLVQSGDLSKIIELVASYVSTLGRHDLAGALAKKTP